MTDMKWLSDQLAAIASYQARCGRKPTPFNPNPPGNIHDGSTSDAVLTALKAAYPRWLTFAEIKALTRRNGKALGWSLWHLRSQGKIEARAGGDRRSALYQLYRYLN